MRRIGVGLRAVCALFSLGLVADFAVCQTNEPPFEGFDAGVALIVIGYDVPTHSVAEQALQEVAAAGNGEYLSASSTQTSELASFLVYGLGGSSSPTATASSVTSVTIQNGKPFQAHTIGEASVEILIGPEPDPKTADLHLAYSGNQRHEGIPPRTAAVRFEGSWMRVGSPPRITPTLGKRFRVDAVALSSNEVVWTFVPTDLPECDYGLYLKTQEGWGKILLLRPQPPAH